MIADHSQCVMSAGSYGYASEGRGERGESRGEGRGGEGQRGEKRGEGQRDDGRGEGIASYGDEGRVEARASGGEIGLGVGNGGGGVGGGGAGGAGAGGGGVEGRQGAAAAYPQQAHAGHVMPPVYAAGSEGNSYNSGDGRQEQGSLPFMLNLPYGAYERRSESSYGRGDDSSKGGSAKNARKNLDSELEDTDSAGGPVNSNEEPNARTLKRPRLVWTPQLHKRFVDAVGHLGIKNAVPKTIMQLMNVEGLTRENVASHLQKYRLYLKRMQGLSNEGPSASDQLFGSTPLPANLGGLHYMGSQRDDVVGPAFTSPAAVPMPFQGLGSVPLAQAHFGGYDIPFGGMGRGIMQQQPPLMKERTDHVLETENHVHHSHSHSHHNHNQPNSPTQRTLSLFPTTSD